MFNRQLKSEILLWNINSLDINTLTAYIADLRTKKAAELLKTSMLSVAEIAMYVGYPDSNYFVKVFKKRYGMTPSAYRSY